MTTTTVRSERLCDLRRQLHRYPEPAWREFHTTSLIVEALEEHSPDALSVGSEALETEERLGVPAPEPLRDWHDRARRNGAREDVLERTARGQTGVVATVECGDGPTVGVRVDIDGLRMEEPIAGTHRPAAEGFRSEHGGYMHACAHDANTTMGIGLLGSIRESDFDGTLKVFFQPASEIESGGKPMSKTAHLDDVEYLVVVNTGMGYASGEVVAGVDEMYAIERLRAEFTGESSHAAKTPNAGRNAIQAMATATENLYGVPRHADGATRVNVGTVEAGSATNVIAERAVLEADIRGETSAILDFVRDRTERVFEGAAHIHDCDVELETIGQAPSADSDGALIDTFYDALETHPAVTSPIRREPFGTGEDAAWFMNAVSDAGGQSTHVIVGTDLASGHHTPTFGIDEQSLTAGVQALIAGIEAIESSP